MWALHNVGLELSDVIVESTIETHQCSHTLPDLRHKTIHDVVGGCSKPKLIAADVVENLMSNMTSTFACSSPQGSALIKGFLYLYLAGGPDELLHKKFLQVRIVMGLHVVCNDITLTFIFGSSRVSSERKLCPARHSMTNTFIWSCRCQQVTHTRRNQTHVRSTFTWFGWCSA